MYAEPSEISKRVHGGGLAAKLCPTLVTQWFVAHQVPLSKAFPGKNTGVGLPFPSPGDFPNPGFKPKSLALQEISCIAGGFFTN